jgi:hypothetical protein
MATPPGTGCRRGSRSPTSSTSAVENDSTRWWTVSCSTCSNPRSARTYAQSLHAVCRTCTYVHVLALSVTKPGVGPRISDSAIRDAFQDGWVLEDLRPSSYRVIISPEDSTRLNLPAGQPADMNAWLARARRT